jgi:hypothetical protein
MPDPEAVDWFADQPEITLAEGERWYADGTHRAVTPEEAQADRRRLRRYFYFRSLMSGKKATEWKDKDGWTMIISRQSRVLWDTALGEYRDGFVAYITHPDLKRWRSNGRLAPSSFIETRPQPYRAQAVIDGLDRLARARDFRRDREQRALLARWAGEDQARLEQQARVLAETFAGIYSPAPVPRGFRR